MFVQPDAWCEDDSFEHIINFARQISQMCEFVSDSEARKIEKVINTFVKTGAELNAEALAIAADCDVNLMRFWKLVWTIKMDKLSLCANDGPFAYIGKKYIAAEGYVLSNEYGSYKLVDRQQFSQYLSSMDGSQTVPDDFTGAALPALYLLRLRQINVFHFWREQIPKNSATLPILAEKDGCFMSLSWRVNSTEFDFVLSYG